MVCHGEGMIVLGVVFMDVFHNRALKFVGLQVRPRQLPESFFVRMELVRCGKDSMVFEV